MSVLAGSRLGCFAARHGGTALPVGTRAIGRQNLTLKLRTAGVQVRWKAYAPINIGIMFVPQQEAWIVERFGKFHRNLEPGLNFLIPIVDRVKYVQSLKEIAIDIPQQSAITADNVTLSLDGVLFLRVIDPLKASYGVEDPEFSITQLAQTTMRSELGKLPLDKIFRERESLNVSIVESINKASAEWGITCLRYEIRDIELPPRVKEAMQMQVEAERRKRAAILESEGVRAAAINVAEGHRQSRILASEAEKQEQINRASGESAGILALAEARAKGLNLVAKSLSTEDGNRAASLAVAERYVEAFRHLAKSTNTLILPSSTGDISGTVVQAMAIYKQLSGGHGALNQQQQLPSSDTNNQAEYYSDEEEQAAAAAAAKSKRGGGGKSRGSSKDKDAPAH